MACTIRARSSIRFTAGIDESREVLAPVRARTSHSCLVHQHPVPEAESRNREWGRERAAVSYNSENCSVEPVAFSGRLANAGSSSGDLRERIVRAWSVTLKVAGRTVLREMLSPNSESQDALVRALSDALAGRSCVALP